MHFEIDYPQDPPEEFKKLFNQVIIKYKNIIPPWCHLIIVNVENNTGKTEAVEAECIVRHEYREVEITLYSRILTLTPEQREKTLLHELLHICVGELTNFTTTLVSKTIDNSILRDWAEGELVSIEEGLVQDLVRLLYRKDTLS